jgi:hypothetical protein
MIKLIFEQIGFQYINVPDWAGLTPLHYAANEVRNNRGDEILLEIQYHSILQDTIIWSIAYYVCYHGSSSKR